jgi:uncharacterized membrane protein YqhA
MPKFLSHSRFLILVPILGLLLAAAFFFIFGGLGLILLIVNVVIDGIAGTVPVHVDEQTPLVVAVIEYVHQFLVGTVLYITAIGFYQLFIHQIDYPDWLKWLHIDSTEELENALIGVTVVVLAINFMSVVFVGPPDHLVQYGAGIALPIAALAFFIAMRSWSTRLERAKSDDSE